MTDTYLVADLFCGAGGSSTGAQKAIADIGGEMELVAINHWNTAVATHAANHPTARHLVEDVSLVDPEVVVEEGRLDLLMASPECKYYSRARGGKPVHDQGRMNPWVVHNWLTKLDVKCVLIENVPEFVDWGPLQADGKPDKTHKGEHFQAWFLTFQALGYQAEWRMLNAADYGDATTRIRFFLMARKDGSPVVWPEPSHTKGETGMFPGRQPWRGAREIIDWSSSGRSLLDDPKYLKKPLSEKTRRRIARGLRRFGGPLAPLYIRLLDLPDDSGQATPAPDDSGTEQPFILNRGGENGYVRAHSVEAPTPTATTRGAGYLVTPGLKQADGEAGVQEEGAADAFVLPHHRGGSLPRSTEDPIPTITAKGPGYLVTTKLLNCEAEPFVCANRNHNAPKSVDQPIPAVTTNHGGGSFLVEPGLQSFMLGQQSGGAPRSTDQPAPTVTGDGAISLVQPSIVEYYGQSFARSIDDPLSAVTSQGRKHGLVKPLLVEYYGNSGDADVDEPLPTVTTRARHGLANPVVVQLNHGDGSQGLNGDERRVHSVDEPLGSLTTSPGTGLAHSVLIQTSHNLSEGNYAHPPDKPLPALTSKADLCMATPSVSPFLVPNFGEKEGQAARVHDIEEPVPAVTSRGAGSLVAPTLVEPVLKQVQDANVDLRRLVLVDGVPYLLDIRFRMLQNQELARAMGFEDEETSYEFLGNVAEVTKQIGNAVPVHLAAALVRAALGTDPNR